jgi:invasion protein IalB
MKRLLSGLAALAITAALVASPAVLAQDTKAPPAKSAKAKSTPKVGKDQKLCRYRFPDGEQRSWVCQKEQPCCAWDAIKYVKCGSTITNCL